MDAYDLGINDKGIHRVLQALVSELRRRDGGLLIATTDAGAALLGASSPDVVIVPRMKQSVWEQRGLPLTARRLRCAAAYSHREAGAFWGPPIVLHVPEDPEVRWAREPTTDLTGRARRVYSRALMGRSLRHAAVVAASVPSVGVRLADRYGLDRVTTIPLGVDCEVFYPAIEPLEDCVFHLGSSDPRDRTPLVVRAYAAARRRTSLPPLTLGGSLGREVAQAIADEVGLNGLEGVVRLTGRVSDADLADFYRNALVVVQPSSDEGFGLQPLEALASGAPLLVADIPAVREVVGQAACAAPADIESLSDQLVRLTTDAQLRASLRVSGPLVASEFTWRRSADRVLDALGHAARRGFAGD